MNSNSGTVIVEQGLRNCSGGTLKEEQRWWNSHDDGEIVVVGRQWWNRDCGTAMVEQSKWNSDGGTVKEAQKW